MMENYDRTVELMDTAYESAGRGEEQFSKSQDTLQAKLNTLANTWEQFRLKFFDQDFFKNLIDNVNKLLSTVANFDAKKLIGLAAIGVTLGKIVITGFIEEIKKGSAGVQTAWSKFINMPLKERFKWSNSVSQFGFGQTPQRAEAINATLAGAGMTRDTSVDLSTKANQQKILELNKQLQTLRQLKAELDTINNSERSTTAEDEEQLRVLQEQVRTNREKANQLLKELGYEKDISLEEAEQLSNKINENPNTKRTAPALEKIGGSFTSGISTGISAGITTALMTAITSGDMGQALKVGLTTLASTALSVILPSIIEMIITFLGGAGGLILLIPVIITGIGMIAKAHQEANEKAEAEELERLRKVKETNEELRKQQEQILSDLKKAEEERENFEKNRERYEYLQGKSSVGVLTEAETEEMKKIADDFNTNYPDIIKTYDENTGEIEFNTFALQDLTEALEEEETKQKRELQSIGTQQLANADSALKKTNDMMNNALFFLPGDIGSGAEVLQRAAGAHVNQEGHVVNKNDEEIIEFSDDIVEAIDTGTSANFNSFRKEIFDLARSLTLDTAKSIGMDENLYNSVVRSKNTDEFDKALSDASVNLSAFAEQVLEASILQSSDYNDSLIEAGQNLTRTTLTVAGLDEKAVELFSTVSAGQKTVEDFDNGIEGLLNDYTGNYFTDRKSAYKGTGGPFANIDFLNDIKDGNTVKNAQNITDAEYLALWESLGVTKDGSNDTKTFESMFKGSGTNVVNFEELSDELQQALGVVMGVNAQDIWNDNWDTSKYIAQYLQDALTYQRLLNDGIISKEINADDYKIIEQGAVDYYDVLNGYSDQIIDDWKGQLQEAENKIGLDQITDESTRETMQQSVDEATKEAQKKVNDEINRLVAYSGSELTYNEISKSFTGNTIAAINNQIDHLEGATSTQIKKVLGVFAEQTKELTNQEKTILASIDLNSSYDELMDSADTYIKSIAEASGRSLEEATEIYNAYISSATDILSKAIFGKDGFLAIKANINSFYTNYDEQYQDLFDAMQEYYDEGTLKSSTALKLMSGDFANFVKITEDGYTLMADEAEKYYIQMANRPIETATRAITANKKQLREAQKIEKFDKNGTILSTENIKRVRNEEWTEQDFKNHMATYHDLTPSQKDDLWHTLVSIANTSYNSVKEYEQGMIEAINEGEAYLPQVHIQKLVALSEHYIDTTEKVEDLEEELEDLQGDLDDLNADLDELNNDLAEQNEELIENQKAIDDAYKAWQEAIHGTADFQSSIDGLVNYNNLLSETERNITKIKEGLEEIDSVNQGAQSLQQLKSSTETQLGQLGAQKQVIDNAMANVYGNLIANYGDFTQFDQNGMLAFDFSIENADMPDALKEGYQDLIEQYNDFVTQKQDIQDQEDSINKEYLEIQEQFVDARVTMEQKIIEVLKSQQQEEVDQVKEKYDALKEQDDEYIDALEEAIKKQRDLREQETKYEDLAQKQKKLSLMQRDTSGANQKDVQSLEDEIQEDRQDLLNDEVDNIIDSLKELYEKQTEARELEIQAMEETIEDMSLLNEMAQNIMAGFQNSDDIISWFVGNNTEVDDMTVNQTEQYINEVRKDSSQFLTAVAAQTEDVTLDAQNVADTSQEVFDSVSQGITDVGDVTQATAEKTAQEAIDNAHKAYDEAVQAMVDTQAKIEETKQKIADTNNSIIETENALAQKDKELSNALVTQQDTMKNTMSEMTRYAKGAMEETAIYATNFIIDAAGDEFDFSTTQGTTDFLNKHGLIRNNEISKGTYEALRNRNAAIDNAIKVNWGSSFEVFFDPPGASGFSASLGTGFESRTAAEDFISAYIRENPSRRRNEFGIVEHKRYAKGGLVDYTGPAWVDGTKSAPEAFLSAEDTRRIGEAAQILAQIPALQSTSTTSNISTTNVGDTTIEIHLNIDKIANDYDIDQMVNRLKRDIVDISNGVGSSVILKK